MAPPSLSLFFLHHKHTSRTENDCTEQKLTVLGNGGRLGQREVSVLQERKVSNRVLGEELGGLVIALHGEGRVVLELNTSEGGSS